MKFEKTAEVIKHARRKSGLSQAELAKMLGGYSKNLIYLVEKGEVSLAARHWKKLSALVSREKLMRAYLNDIEKQTNEALDGIRSNEGLGQPRCSVRGKRKA